MASKDARGKSNMQDRILIRCSVLRGMGGSAGAVMYTSDLARRKLRQEDYKFKTSLNYIVRSYIMKKDRKISS